MVLGSCAQEVQEKYDNMLLFSDPTTHTIGIDLSDNVFRLVQIKRGRVRKGRLKLARYAEERLVNGLIIDGEIKDFDGAVTHLKSLVKKAYGRQVSRGVTVSLPDTRSFVKVISVKKPENAANLGRIIAEEAALHIPTPLDELYIDWQVVDKKKNLAVGKKMEIIFGAAPKKIVDAHSELLEAAGLIPVAFELEAQSIVRSVMSHVEKKKGEGNDKAYGIIDFGANRSSLIVYHRDTIQFTVSIPLSGDAVTKTIAEKLQVTPEEAERTKRQCGVDAHRCGDLMWDIMHPFLTEMAGRVDEAVTFYQDHFEHGKKLDEIVISGGGANMLRIDELLTELTGTKVVTADPWLNIDPDKCPLPREIILSSTTVVGLALRHALGTPHFSKDL